MNKSNTFNMKNQNQFHTFLGTVYDLSKIAAISECKVKLINDTENEYKNFALNNLSFGCDITYIAPFPKLIPNYVPASEFYASGEEFMRAEQDLGNSKNFQTEEYIRRDYDRVMYDMKSRRNYSKNFTAEELAYTFEKYLEEHGGLEKQKKCLKEIESMSELIECLNKGKLSSWNWMKAEVNDFIQTWVNYSILE